VIKKRTSLSHPFGISRYGVKQFSLSRLESGTAVQMHGDVPSISRERVHKCSVVFLDVCLSSPSSMIHTANICGLSLFGHSSDRRFCLSLENKPANSSKRGVVRVRGMEKNLSLLTSHGMVPLVLGFV